MDFYFDSINASKKDLREYTLSYVSNVFENDLCEKEHKSFSLHFSSDNKFSGNDIFADIITAFSLIDVFDSAGNTTSSADSNLSPLNSKNDDLLSSAAVDTSGCFLITYDGHTLLVDHFEVKYDNEAVSVVKELSKSNSKFQVSSGRCAYLSYRITNLSDSEVDYKNSFRLIGESFEVPQMDSTLFGLSDAAIVGSGESVNIIAFSCGVLGSELCYYEPNSKILLVLNQ